MAENKLINFALVKDYKCEKRLRLSKIRVKLDSAFALHFPCSMKQNNNIINN
jgi:hypothetical protein